MEEEITRPDKVCEDGTLKTVISYYCTGIMVGVVKDEAGEWAG